MIMFFVSLSKYMDSLVMLSIFVAVYNSLVFITFVGFC